MFEWEDSHLHDAYTIGSDNDMDRGPEKLKVAVSKDCFAKSDFIVEIKMAE